MKTKNSDVAHRAWKLVRLALLWTRKGGVLRDRIVMDLRLLPKYFKRLRHQENNHRAVYYGERQLSFDETPIFRHKMHRPSSLRFKMPQMPCIKPQVDFDYDFDYDYNNSNNTYDDENNKCYYNDFPRKSSSGDDSLRKSRSLESTSGDDEEEEYDDSSFETFEELHNDSIISYRPSDVKNDHENEIDLKAEKFIATFYEQMKLQRQTSYLQYN